MKKHGMIFLLMILSMLLFACTNPDPTDDTDIRDDAEETYDLGGIDFVIRANVASRINPRSEDFERMYRNERLTNIAKVEEKYNVKVKYLNYPTNASWGIARDNWIIEQAQLGTTESHVFEVTSNSVANLAVQGAILPLDDLIEKYGNPGLWSKKRGFGTVLGQSYVYDDTYSQAEEGIYYNSDLLASVLGESRRLEPTELWEQGNWTWSAFQDLALEIKDNLNHERPESEGGPQYVLGGRTYDWFYPMVGSNGGQLVDNSFQSHVNDDKVIETLNFLNQLYDVNGMWIDDADMSNYVQQEFRNGNIVFHAGENWFLIVPNWWGGLEFKLDFVPYPKGPRVEAGEETYVQTKVKTEASFVISSAFAKENIPEGYEDMFLHDEIIFKIWNDLLYFPEIDIETGEADLFDIMDNYYSTRLLPFYASERSREAHLDIYDLAQIDHFYSVYEGEELYRLRIENAIRDGDVRSKMESLHQELQAVLEQRILNR